MLKKSCSRQARLCQSCRPATLAHGLCKRGDTARSNKKACRGVCFSLPGGSNSSREYETEEQTLERRLRESARVEERVTICEDLEHLRNEVRSAGDNLVVLEIHGDGVCETGLDEEPELHWTIDQKHAEAKRLEACVKIKHAFQRIARDSTDVKFLSIIVPEDEEGEEMKDVLGVDTLPTVQFYKSGKFLWQQSGSVGMEQQMGEGVLYYGNSAAGGLKATDYVHELHSRQDYQQFVQDDNPDMLTVVNISTSMCAPCIKVYPAVVALARNFVGHVKFARFMGDQTDETQAMMGELNILEVPTFIFYREGKEVGRHVGSSRGDLIGQILQQQAAAGIAPPPAPRKEKSARRGSRAKVPVE